MTTWITSDLHFGHRGIMRFCPDTRKFDSVEHMNSEMIRMWNELVTWEDTVYILGDVAFMGVTEAVNVLNCLNGRKILVAGNHDSKLIRDHRFLNCFAEVHQYLEITHNGHRIIMCHYPFHYEWNQAHRGSIHFFGHVHGKKTGLEEYRARDVGMDATGRVVSNLDEMIAEALKGKLSIHH